MDDAARLPCLATGTPAPATTSAATVEMLNVPLRSPPVPQVSTTGTGGATGFANPSIVSASPSISSTVSPLVRSAIRRPPTCAGVASPDITTRIAAAASSRSREVPAAIFDRTCGQRSGSGCVMGHRRLAGWPPNAVRGLATLGPARSGERHARAWFNGRTQASQA